MLALDRRLAAFYRGDVDRADTLDAVTSTLTARERRRLQRWIAAIALTDAAERSAMADTPETNAMALLSAHAAAETLLGLIVGHRNYKRGEDIPFPDLAKDAVAALKQRHEPALPTDLLDDLDGMHRGRNAFVHAASAVHASEAEQAIGAARELADHIPGRSAAAGIAGAVARIIDIEYVAIWLDHADDMLRASRIQLAADALARALDGALHRTDPRLVDRWERRLSRAEKRASLQRVNHGGPAQSATAPLADAIEGLTDWVLPLALGVSPADYAAVRRTIGYESAVDLGGSPRPVRRPPEPTTDDVRRAAGTVSVMVFRLWATGTLRAGREDAKRIGLAQPFIADPRGIAAGERPEPDTP